MPRFVLGWTASVSSEPTRYLLFLPLQKATISHVSPDSLYLFRVQAVCRNDMRSDFSQTMLFQGKSGYCLCAPPPTVPNTASFLRDLVHRGCKPYPGSSGHWGLSLGLEVSEADRRRGKAGLAIFTSLYWCFPAVPLVSSFVRWCGLPIPAIASYLDI